VGSLADRAYLTLKRSLIELEIPPGALLTESHLAARLGLGKTPVREALQRLVYRGFVEVMPRAGYRAKPVTIEDVRDLMALRLLLEEEAASAAARRSSQRNDLEALDALCVSSYDPSDRATIAAFLDANTAFHLAIAGISGNQRLVDVLRSLLEQSERLMRIGLAFRSRSDEIVHEHQDLVRAIAAGDRTRARRVSRLQVKDAETMVINALLSSPSLLSAPVAIDASSSASELPPAAGMTPESGRLRAFVRRHGGE
jgi:DNA-binding GntR family transcriptional regulator